MSISQKVTIVGRKQKFLTIYSLRNTVNCKGVWCHHCSTCKYRSCRGCIPCANDGGEFWILGIHRGSLWEVFHIVVPYVGNGGRSGTQPLLLWLDFNIGVPYVSNGGYSGMLLWRAFNIGVLYM